MNIVKTAILTEACFSISIKFSQEYLIGQNKPYTLQCNVLYAISHCCQRKGPIKTGLGRGGYFVVVLTLMHVCSF